MAILERSLAGIEFKAWGLRTDLWLTIGSPLFVTPPAASAGKSSPCSPDTQPLPEAGVVPFKPEANARVGASTTWSVKLSPKRSLPLVTNALTADSGFSEAPCQ